MCPDGLNPPKVEIHTEAQAVNYVERLTTDMLDLRAVCDQLTKNPKTPELALKRSFWIFMKKHGEVIGALNAFRLTGMIPERAWVELHQKAINALAPTVVPHG